MVKFTLCVGTRKNKDIDANAYIETDIRTDDIESKDQLVEQLVRSFDQTIRVQNEIRDSIKQVLTSIGCPEYSKDGKHISELVETIIQDTLKVCAVAETSTTITDPNSEKAKKIRRELEGTKEDDKE